MRRARGLGLPAMVLGLLLVSGCGDETQPRDASSSTPSPSPSPSPTASFSASASPSASGPTAVATALTLDALRRRVLAAVHAETSVHMEVGNLNPPPPQTIDQDYSTREGDLEAVLEVEPGRAPTFVLRRVDGAVYLSFDGGGFRRLSPQQVAEAEETGLTALLRTDVVRDLTSLFAGAVKGEFQGADASLGAGVTRYELEIDTSAWFGAQDGGMALGLKHAAYPKVVPARLWVASTGLPVRLEVRYSEPLNGIEGTGTVRVDYSRWSELVEIERPLG